MSEEVDTSSYNTYKDKTIGRTRADLVYSVRYYLAAFVIITALWFFGVPLPTQRITVILPAAVLGLVLGLLRGYYIDVPVPPPIFLFKPESPSSARLIAVYDYDALILEDTTAMPLGTPYGATIRLVDDVSIVGGKIYAKPSMIHKVAVLNPLDALAHIRSISRLAEELDDAIRRYVELYVSTKTTARQLARRRIADLLTLERQVERAAKELIKDSLEGKKKEKK